MNKVLQSNRQIFPKLSEIFIDGKAIEDFVRSLLNQKLETSELHLFENDWNLSDYFKLTLIFNSMNFCYWAEKDKPKWTITIDGKELDGSIALVRLLERLAVENKNFLDWKYLSNLSLVEFEGFFKGSNVKIPLLEERHKNLTNLAQNIVDSWEGSSDNLLKSAENQAEKLLEKLVAIECFVDQSEFAGETVYFWKRAQLQVKMFNDYLVPNKQKPLKNLNILTAFADYKVPQLLRHLGILKYSDKLSSMIDNYELIGKDSDLENQIRIATIIGVEKIKELANSKGINITACEIDSLIWNRAATNKDDMKPYHRTYTTAY